MTTYKTVNGWQPFRDFLAFLIVISPFLFFIVVGFGVAKESIPNPRFFVGQTIHLKPVGEAALVVNYHCLPWLGCQYRLRLIGQNESSFWDSDPALP